MTRDLTDVLADARMLLGRSPREEPTRMAQFAKLLRDDARQPHVAPAQAVEARALAEALESKLKQG